MTAPEIKLSERQHQVLVGIAAGKTIQQIAGDLFLSAHTVKLHLDYLFDKLGVTKQAAAVHQAHLRGLLGGES